MTRPPQFASPGELDHEQAIGYGLDNPDRLEWLRTETYEDRYRIDLWDTNETNAMGKSQLAYRLSFFHEQGGVWEIIFAGEDLYAGLSTCIDSDAMLATILSFLSMTPESHGEPEYFTKYTKRQLAFAEEHGELLAIWSSDLEGAN